MTPRSAAERGPRTVAGRALLDSMRGKYRPGTLGWLGADTWIPTILAIEAEAAAPLDVERLARALTSVTWHKWRSERVDDTHTRNLARAIAAAYVAAPATPGASP